MRAATRTRWKGYPIILGCFLALIAITAWEAASSHAGYDVTIETDSESGRLHKIRMGDGRWRLDVEYRGEIEMTPDEQAIARLGPDAYLEIEERDRRQRRYFEATPGAGGVPEIVWRIDGDPAAFDSDAELWLAGVLKRVYRATGHDAEGRVGRLLAAGGTAAVLGEISKIDSDHVARVYFEQLLAQADLNDQELARFLRQMAREIGSDHELRQVMQAMPSSVPAREATAGAWLAAARTIGSDHELRQTLSHFLQRSDLVPAGYEPLVDAAVDVSNDFELAELLAEVAESYPEARALPVGFGRALETVGNDFEQRKALGAALERPGLDAEQLDRLLARQAIGSDYELAELLAGLARSYEGELPGTYFLALSSIGSDFELRKALGAALERPGLDDDTVSALLEAAIAINSDHQQAELLRQVAAVHPVDGAVRPAFDRALATIGSDHQRRQVLAVVGD